MCTHRKEKKKTYFHELLWGGGEDSPLHPPVDETIVTAHVGNLYMQ